MADSTERDETDAEKETQEETGATPDESHRVGEFDDIRDRLEKVTAKLDSIYDFIVKNAVKSESDDESESESDESIELVPIDELDI